MELDHVWFDCNGTLYALTPDITARRDNHVCSKISALLKRPESEVRTRFQQGRKEYGTRLSSIKNMFGLSALDASDIAQGADITDLLNPDPLLNEALICLKQKNLDISIYTNDSRPELFAVLSKLGVDLTMFKYMMTNEEGGGKPSGFDEVIVRSKCDPFELMFVGDSERADIAPARRLGMNTLLVGAEALGIERDIEHDEKFGTYHFRRKAVYEVVSVVESLGNLGFKFS
ncbi:MAG: HAD hydrolase-like protein [Candidatus Woesearchaeota archaeon]|nr:HAD hydrolase-like protein [Candidatus Woesearchaeota archaeon]